MSQFKPMLAADISDQLDKLRFPVYVTPKLDGVRALVFADGVYSRSMKKIPNKRVQELLGFASLAGIDGELIVGDPTAPDVYRRTLSVTATAGDETPVTLWAFDLYNTTEPYHKRLAVLKERVGNVLSESVRVVDAYECSDLAQLNEYEGNTLAEGFEGCILRSREGLYKFGRSTVKEQGMLKLKRFTDGEAEIIGIEEEMHNGNEAKTDALGRTERSSHKANLTGKGRMGALIVRDLQTKVEFKIGTGFTAKDREEFWRCWPRMHEEAAPRLVKYKHFAIGAKDKPRFPTYVGMREGWDL